MEFICALLFCCVVILISILFNEVRLRLRDIRRFEELKEKLAAAHAINAQLTRENAELRTQLHYHQHVYIFDLPVHLPGSFYNYESKN